MTRGAEARAGAARFSYVPGRVAAAVRRAGATRPVRAAVRFRWAVLGLLTALGVLAGAGTEPTDAAGFARAGELLLSARWAEAFADPGVQAGPLLLLGYGAIAKAARATAVSAELLQSLLIHAGAVWLVVRLVRRACRDRLPGAATGGRELAAGLLVLALDVPGTAYLSGHPSELAVALLWSHAALDLRAGRERHAVARIVVAAGVVTQGALGVAILFARPGALRRSVLPAAVGAAGCAAWYLPFRLFGTVRTHELTWPVAEWSALEPLFGAGHHVGWSVRLVQGALAAATGVLLARLLRADRSAYWMVPAAIVAVRVATDPLVYEYYWTGAQALYVVAVCASGGAARGRRLPAYAAGYALLLNGVVPASIPAVVVLAGIAGSAVRLRRGEPDDPEPPAPATSAARRTEYAEA